MSKSTRRPQRIYSIVMWALSLVFAGFLIGLGSLIIKDLPQVDRNVKLEQFMDKAELDSIYTLQENQRREISLIQRKLEDTRIAQQSASEDYNSAKSTFDNWLKTRTATEASSQNPEVLSRTRNVETLRDAERDSLRKVETQQNALVQAQRSQTDLSARLERLRSAARPAFNNAKRGREFRVFLFRLALTLPLLIVGGLLLAKKRQSPYWPLYRGFILFALFSFFVELVPYLPWYGGYVRYTVGLILIAVAGHFIIRGMRKYMARKKEEESRSEGERRKSIEYETALKKIAAKSCPGCDRSIVNRDGAITDFCVHCGIRLQQECKSCGQRNVSFHKFCLSCGTPSEDLAIS